MTPAGRYQWLLHVGVVLALFLAARWNPNLNTFPIILVDLLACFSAVLVLRWPVAACVLGAGVFGAVNIAPELWGPAQFAFVLTLLGLSAFAPVAGAVASIASVATMLLSGLTRNPVEIFLDMALLGGVWGAGSALHSWRRRERATAQRAAELRTSLAQDLHDSISAGQAHIIRAAQRALDSELATSEIREALHTIIEEARQSSVEVHTLLARLRGEAATDERLPATLAEEFDVQVERLRAAGFTPRIDAEEELLQSDRLPRSIGRILHECVTNVIKHGSTGPCEMSLYRSGELAILKVVNPVAEGASPSRTGLGLAGMAERLTAMGGGITWGLVGDQWVLDAFVPLPRNAEGVRAAPSV